MERFFVITKNEKRKLTVIRKVSNMLSSISDLFCGFLKAGLLGKDFFFPPLIYSHQRRACRAEGNKDRTRTSAYG
jgi:hypothetical protein